MRIILILYVILMSNAAIADSYCFLVKEGDKILKQEGNECEKRFAPQSTFKIALSVMGFDSGILKNKDKPRWEYSKEYEAVVNAHKKPHNPRTWMRDSCVWYSRVLTQKLGIEKFRDYVEKFKYGNKDTAGKDALTNSWISNSLRISPLEQIDFLQNFINKKLLVNDRSYKMTKKIMFIQELSGGWKLYGKTGYGNQLDNNGDKTDLGHGWFVGFIEKDNKIIIFASHLSDDKKRDTFTSFRVRNDMINKLWYITDQLEG